jgi:hypothetical protein
MRVVAGVLEVLEVLAVAVQVVARVLLVQQTRVVAVAVAATPVRQAVMVARGLL